jgi:hypothetical protein
MTNPDILAIIAIGVSILTLGVSILTFAANAFLSRYLAKKYGDVAGAEAAIKYQQEQAAKARVVALQSLLNEIERIRKLADHNSKQIVGSGVQRVFRMPTTAFETAFFSRESVLLENWKDSSDSEILASAIDYLNEADSINVLADLYLGLVRGLSSDEKRRRNDIITQVASKCQEISGILNRLEENLRREESLE